MQSLGNRVQSCHLPRKIRIFANFFTTTGGRTNINTPGMATQNLNPTQGICPYYFPETGVIPRYITLKAGESMKLSNKTEAHFLFVLSGELSLSFSPYKDIPVRQDEMFFLVNGRVFEWEARADTTLVLSGYNTSVFRCTNDRMEALFKVKAGLAFDCRGTLMKDEVKAVVRQIKHYLEAGINCHHLYTLKYEELYLLFRYYYTATEVAQLFYLGLKNNLLFSDRVLNSYLHVKTVRELAELLGYSVKTFEKMFRETFDDSPYHWMQKRKALHIRQKLMDPGISLKQIMYDFKFATYSHFNFYCKQHLGATPTELRSKTPENGLNAPGRKI